MNLHGDYRIRRWDEYENLDFYSRTDIAAIEPKLG